MKLRFEYSYIFDLEIADLSGKKVDVDLVKSMDSFVPNLNQLWQKRGQPLVELAVRISGLTFKQSEAKCILTLSEFVSMSHPLIVNVRKYLDGSDSEMLIEVIFHEVLHILLTDNWKIWPTTLIAKHAGGNDVVAAHVHLMAIERAVHKTMGSHNHLSLIESWYKKIGNGYDVAWSLISQENLYRELIQELGDSSQWALRP